MSLFVEPCEFSQGRSPSNINGVENTEGMIKDSGAIFKQFAQYHTCQYRLGPRNFSQSAPWIDSNNKVLEKKPLQVAQAFLCSNQYVCDDCLLMTYHHSS